MPKNDKRFPRVDQLLSSLGYGSRKQIDAFIRDARVSVEGLEKFKSDLRVDPRQIRFDGEPLDHPEGLLIALNKPCGYVCSHQESEGASVYELLPARWNLRSPKVVSVGRLDKDTSGLLILTDQHDLVHALTSPKKHVEKVYEATLERAIDPKTAETFASGELMLRGESKPCLPARLEILNPTRARVTIQEGRYHQVRRMFAAVGSHVVTLKRLRFGKLELDGLKEGSFKVLAPELSSVV